MPFRSRAALCLVLAFLAAPVTALVCESSCGAAGQATIAATPGDSCHRQPTDDTGRDARMEAGRACEPHGATLPAVPVIKANGARALMTQTHPVTFAEFGASRDAAAARRSIAEDSFAPPGPGPRLVAPLRI